MSVKTFDHQCASEVMSMENRTWFVEGVTHRKTGCWIIEWEFHAASLCKDAVWAHVQLNLPVYSFCAWSQSRCDLSLPESQRCSAEASSRSQHGMWAKRINSHRHHVVPLLLHLPISWGSCGNRECFLCWSCSVVVLLATGAWSCLSWQCLLNPYSVLVNAWNILPIWLPKFCWFFFPQMLKYITICRVMCPILSAEYDLGIFCTLRQNPCIVQSVSMQCSTSFPLDTQPSIADKGFWRQI